MHIPSSARLAPLSLLLLSSALVLSCSDADEGSQGGPAGSDAGAGDAATESSADAPVGDAPVSDVTDAGTLEDAVAEDASPEDASPEDALLDGPGTDASYPLPTATDIQFEAVNALSSGEYLLFNDWDAWPNNVSAMTLDGATTTEIFRAFRVWSMGVSRAGDKIAFACGDPDQEQNYGLTFGDSIQHTWLYDIATQSVQVVAYGNINDECHVFGPGDQWLYVCRRYDFTPAGAFKGWRLGRIHLATQAFEFLSPEVDKTYALFPQPTIDETQLYYGTIELIGSPPTQQQTILRVPLPSGTPETIRTEANRPVISPNGTRYLFQNHQDARFLWSSALDGSDAFQVVAREASEPVWSPDGTRVAYLMRDSANNCDHIEVVAADGSDANAPTRVRDCSQTGEFITELDWISVP